MQPINDEETKTIPFVYIHHVYIAMLNLVNFSWKSKNQNLTNTWGGMFTKVPHVCTACIYKKCLIYFYLNMPPHVSSLMFCKWWGKKTFKIGALEDISMASPFFIVWETWEPSIYMTPFLPNHVASMDWWDLINPCIKLEATPGEMGSLTIYWRSWDNMGIGNPPAESIAAVDPAAVETLRPLDRECAKGAHGWSSPLILQTMISNL